MQDKEKLQEQKLIFDKDAFKELAEQSEAVMEQLESIEKHISEGIPFSSFKNKLIDLKSMLEKGESNKDTAFESPYDTLQTLIHVMIISIRQYYESIASAKEKKISIKKKDPKVTSSSWFSRKNKTQKDKDLVQKGTTKSKSNAKNQEEGKLDSNYLF